MTKRTTSTNAIRDVLARAGSLDDAPVRASLSSRIGGRVIRVVLRHRRRGVTRRSLLAVAAATSCTPTLAAPARADGFRQAWASWYGPALWGNPLGCGGTLWPATIGVANKTMPCGKRLRICADRCATVRVIDRGPYVGGREFDLTAATARRVGFTGVGLISVRAARTHMLFVPGNHQARTRP